MSTLDTREVGFLLNQVLDLPGLLACERFAHLSPEVVDEVLQTASRIAEHYFAPCHREHDETPPFLAGDRIDHPESLETACRAFIDAGLMRAHLPESEGGLELPACVHTATLGFFQAANLPASAYLTLTIGAANLLRAHGDHAVKDNWMDAMYDGRFFGTMALSEPQAGSSLSDLSTLAQPMADGSWSITGNKQWISAGEHELSENIVHMMLVRTPDAPPGVRGISLMLVPRRRLDDSGRPTIDNDVRLVSLLHKMGYRATTSTILAMGSDDNCRGWLIGREGDGLKCMFDMMNEARIGVGLSGAALGYAGFRYSLEYAGDRRQGRPPGEKDPTRPMVPIARHADVRHMLLKQKCYAEGGLALGLYCASLLDYQQTAGDSRESEDMGLLLDLLTPVAKAWSSDYGVAANSLAIQVLGGNGYTIDYPVEQLYRDNRLNPIHEGTNGIQALDLLGRKVHQAEGRALRLLADSIRATIDQAASTRELESCARSLADALNRLENTTARLADVFANDGIEPALSGASTYLNLTGHVVVGWLWLRQGVTARAALECDAGDRSYLSGKLAACRYFHRWELPMTSTWADLLSQPDHDLLELDPSTL